MTDLAMVLDRVDKIADTIRDGAAESERLGHLAPDVLQALHDTDLFGAMLAGARLAGADLRGAEVSGVDLLALATRAGLKITLDQQYPLLTGLGIDVCLD